MLNSNEEMKENDNRRTVDVNDEVLKCEKLSELKELLNCNSDYYSEWKYYINLLMERSHMNYVQMSKACHCSRNTIKKWCRQGAIPQNRETFFKIGFAFRLTLDEFNRMLQKHGKYSKLYAKNMDDAVCIFVINHYPEDGDAYECYLQLKEHLLRRLREEDAGDSIRRNTEDIEDGILSKESMDEFEDFIIANKPSYKQAFYKLIEFVELFIKEKAENIHRFVSYNGLDFAYEKMMSTLRMKGECPERLRLILLGVHLNMSLEQINYMLELAYMEPMCAKDNIECIVMYVVENAYLNNSAYTIESAIILQHYDKNPELQEKCKAILRRYWGTEGYRECKQVTINEGDLEYIDNSIGEYLKYVLAELEWDDDTILRYL